MMRQRAVRSFAVQAAGAALLAALCGCDRASPPVRAFRGAYAAEAQPTGKVHEFALTAAPAEIALPDGRPLAVWAYNGQVPGPTLRVRRGDTVRATLTNRLSQPTTIHWHGVRVPNAMDGVPHVTQPPVEPGGTFVYEFPTKDAGTFWFHPHLRSPEQIERGLYGVLVVEDPEPAPFSRDLVWVLDDWLLSPQGDIVPEFVTRHDLAHDGRWGNVPTVNGSPRFAIDVQPGERIRLRLVNVANGRVFAPDFSAFDARVIAVDGLYAARPLDLAGFVLAPGNRLDLDLTVPRTLRGPQIIADRFTRQPFTLATVQVTDTEVATPTFPSPATGHVPAWNDLAAEPPRLTFQLNARTGGSYGIEWTINDQTLDHTHDLGHHGTPYTLPLGEWSKLRFENVSYRLHPMHMHGLFFKVLARNGTPVDEPYFRDTVLVRAKETVDVGTVPIDPGRWMAHCHILEHAEAGMMTLVEVR
jgi:FtsP/CotA-like multicopper oxidase with cupredoxin domain